MESQSSLASLWYCRIHGLERGPITWDMLQDLARGGDLRPSDMVRRGDDSEWTLASQARYDAPPRMAVPIESKLTARLAAALSADVLAAHAPATVYRRESAAVAEVIEAAGQLDAEASIHIASRDTRLPNETTDDLTPAVEAAAAQDVAPEVDPEVVPIPASQPSIDEDGPVLTLTDEPAEAPAASRHAEAVQAQSPARLPAAAAADAARNRRPTNPAGIALLALGLALVGLFKLALPLGLLSLYLAWRSASDLRSRPQSRGAVPTRVGLATAAAAMAVAGVDVGVSVYHIAGRW